MSKTFGQTLRARRIFQGFGLRQFARIIDVSPTYLSRLEWGKADLPSARLARKIAETLGESVDEWSARAGKIADDLLEIFRSNPAAIGDLLRAVKGLDELRIRRLCRSVLEMSRFQQ